MADIESNARIRVRGSFAVGDIVCTTAISAGKGTNFILKKSNLFRYKSYNFKIEMPTISVERGDYFVKVIEWLTYGNVIHINLYNSKGFLLYEDVDATVSPL